MWRPLDAFGGLLHNQPMGRHGTGLIPRTGIVSRPDIHAAPLLPMVEKGRTMSKTKPNDLIPAVGYLRKSTRGEVDDGSGKRAERQERSIPQQKKEITALAQRNGYRIVRWYADPGISGWKRGLQRPDFEKMIRDAEEQADFVAVLCDNVDRFSRAEVDQVQEDARRLRLAGVRWIVSAADGLYDLGRSGNDIAEILKFAVKAWSAHEFCRQLSRRMSIARRNAAQRGKRSGGEAPLGYANDGEGGLIFGPPSEVELVRWVFEQFTHESRSMNSITADLNQQGKTTRRGNVWRVAQVKELLRRKAYAGDFTYNEKKSGRFFIIDENHEVVPADDAGHKAWQKTPEGMFFERDTHPAIIDRDTFDKAQARLASFSLKGKTRKPRKNGFALTNILHCAHCGKPLYGCTPRPGRPREYRCPTNSIEGGGSCGYYAIKEESVLDIVLQLMGKEFEKLKLESPQPPTKRPGGATADIDQVKQRLETTERKMDNAADLLVDEGHNVRTRDRAQQRLRDLEREHEELKSEMVELLANGDADRDRDMLLAWWHQFRADAVTVPIEGGPALEAARKVARATGSGTTSPLRRRAGGGWTLKISQRALNEALVAVGCEVRVSWERTQVPTKKGTTMSRNFVSEIGLSLGETAATFCSAPLVEASSCPANVFAG